MTKLYSNTVGRMLGLSQKIGGRFRSKKGMELVQVGILIAIAVGIGIIFKDKIGTFINETFSALLGAKFS